MVLIRLARIVMVTLVGSLVTGCLGSGGQVDTVTVVNPSDFELTVQVAPADGGSWITLGISHPEVDLVVHDVVDQGEEWVFRFQHWGETVGTVSVTRSELERDVWRVEVPGPVVERLRELDRPSST